MIGLGLSPSTMSILAGVLSSGTSQPVTLSAPAAFSAWSPPVAITQSGSTYSHNFNAATYIPSAPALTLYVNPLSGVDTAAGTSTAPIKTLEKARSLGNANGGDVVVNITGLTADFVGRGSYAFQTSGASNSLTCNLYVINRTGFRYYMVGAPSSGAPVYTKSSGYTNVYQSSFTAANSSQVSDHISSQRVYPVLPGNITHSDHGTVGLLYTSVADIATCDATPGSFVNVSSVLYVHPIDGRDLTVTANAQWIAVTSYNSSMGTTLAGSHTIYLEGFDLIGGATPWRVILSSSAYAGVSGRVILKNVTFQFGKASTGGADGLTPQGQLEVYSQRVLSYKTWTDNFGYHSYVGGGALDNTSGHFLEVECAGIGAGTTGDTGTDNATSAHEQYIGISINGVYGGGIGRVMGDTHSAMRWDVGSKIYGSIGTSSTLNTNVAASTNANIYLQGSQLIANVNPLVWAADSTTAIYYRDTSPSTLSNSNGGAGTVAAF